MTGRQRCAPRLGASILGGLAFCSLALAQPPLAPNVRVPIPNDWSHRHVIFSRPATSEQTAQVEADPRYWQQRYRNELPASLERPERSASGLVKRAAMGSENPTQSSDWQENLGSGGSAGGGNFPAKFSFAGTTANCGNAAQPDFVTYNTGLTASTTQASVLAYDNLYSGCTGTVPSTYWAYNTGGQVLTSPTYSVDGKQVAFVQTNGGLNGNLVLLKWAASTTESVSTPATPATASSATQYFSGCAAPCMISFLLTNSSGTPANDTSSSVFVDYSDDTAYVGDSHGWLHKFNPVFKAAPAEVRTGGWPVQVNPTSPSALSDAIFDRVTKNVFVGDLGGVLYLVTSTGAVTKSGQLDFGAGIIQGPILDPVAKSVYVFSSSDGTANCAGGVACSAVYQLSTSFTAGSTGSEVVVGNSLVTGSATNPNPLYLGAFDSAYESSPNATGNLYVCGNTGGNPTVYRIPIAAGVLGPASSSVAALTPAADNPSCSPVTDVLNPNATGGAFEHLFFSVQNNAHPTLCAGKGCALSFAALPWQATTSYRVGQEILVLRTQNSMLYENVAVTAGTSGATPPTWPAQVGVTASDGTVTWLNQGANLVTALASWAGNHAYALHARILDSNGNIEIATVAGTSAGTVPVWKTTAGLTISDGTVTWTNAGVLPSSALPAAGGTSGIIIDNTVQTLTGASQVYFSTLSNQTCTTSGTTGGCAVQASQSALK
jgi:hypothetical protein